MIIAEIKRTPFINWKDTSENQKATKRKTSVTRGHLWDTQTAYSSFSNWTKNIPSFILQHQNQTVLSFSFRIPINN
jgi:hypothetical protein